MTTETLFVAQTGGFGMANADLDERLVVEYYDDNPRMYVRHQKRRGSNDWRTIRSWELHPTMGVTNRGASA